eukprot:scaffold9774_cov143-Isochrysis_galbana.AAC.2
MAGGKGAALEGAEPPRVWLWLGRACAKPESHLHTSRQLLLELMHPFLQARDLLQQPQLVGRKRRHRRETSPAHGREAATADLGGEHRRVPTGAPGSGCAEAKLSV